MRIEEADDELRIHVCGELVAAHFETFDNLLRGYDVGRRRLVLDLTQLTAIDSSGLGMLLVTRELMHARRVVIRGASKDLGEVLTMINFRQLFEIE